MLGPASRMVARWCRQAVVVVVVVVVMVVMVVVVMESDEAIQLGGYNTKRAHVCAPRNTHYPYAQTTALQECVLSFRRVF
jgi:hypothetical protein